MSVFRVRCRARADELYTMPDLLHNRIIKHHIKFLIFFFFFVHPSCGDDGFILLYYMFFLLLTHYLYNIIYYIHVYYIHITRTIPWLYALSCKQQQYETDLGCIYKRDDKVDKGKKMEFSPIQVYI